MSVKNNGSVVAPAPVRWTAVVSIGLLAASLAVALSRFAADLALAAQRPEFALTYTGGVVAWLSSHPELLYHPLDQAPFFPTIYTPLYPLLANLLYTVTGLPLPGLQRGIGLFAATATAVILGRIVVETTGHRLGGLVAGGLYLLTPAVTRATVLSRVDHLGMLFGVLAVSVAIRSEHGDLRAVAKVAALCVLTLLVKQSLVVFPAAIFLAYLVSEYRADALTFAHAGVVFGAVAVLPATLLTDGRFWIHTLVINGQNPILLSRLLEQASWTSYVHLPLFAVGAVLTWTYDREASDMPVAVPVLFVVGAAAALATMGKAGSWIGYAYPAIAASALCVGYAAARHVPRVQPDWTWLMSRASIVVLVVVAAQLAIFASWAPSTVTEADNQRDVASIIEQADGPVLSEDVGLLVATGKSEAFEPLVMRYVASQGVWDERQLTNQIESQEFAVIVTWQPVESDSAAGRWTEQQKDSITANYRLDQTFGKYHVYVPTRGETGE